MTTKPPTQRTEHPLHVLLTESPAEGKKRFWEFAHEAQYVVEHMAKRLGVAVPTLWRWITEFDFAKEFKERRVAAAKKELEKIK